jgi:hypothetical protein
MPENEATGVPNAGGLNLCIFRRLAVDFSWSLHFFAGFGKGIFLIQADGELLDEGYAGLVS